MCSWVTQSGLSLWRDELQEISVIAVKNQNKCARFVEFQGGTGLRAQRVNANDQLEGCRAFQSEPVAMHGVLKFQARGMQAQACTECDHGGRGVQGIAQHRVTDMGHVHAQLVRSTRDGLQPHFGAAQRHAGLIGVALIARLAGLAAAVLHDLQGAAFPVTDEGCIHQAPAIAGQGGHIAVHDGRVIFVNLARSKGITQLALHRFGTCQDKQARGGHIQPVHDQGIGPVGQSALDQAVLFVFAATWYGQQSRRFIKYQQVLVCIQTNGAVRGQQNLQFFGSMSRSTVSHS